MSAYNRYSFTKEVYPDYIVLLIKKDKYYSYGKDRKILEYIKFRNKTSILRNKKINYLVLDELDIVEKYEYLDNQFYRYMYWVRLNKVLEEVKVVMSYKYRVTFL